MAIPKIRNLIEARVKDTGDTITGNLVVEKSTYPSIALGNTTTGTRTNLQTWDNSSVLQCFLEAGNTDNRRGLFLKNSRAVTAVRDALALRDWIDGAYTEYKIYGEHNKDLIKQFCLPLTGGTLTGNLKIGVDGNPYYELNDGTNSWYFQSVKGDNACYIGPGYTLATKIDTSGNMTVRGTITVNTAIVPDVAGGANVGTGSLPFLQTVARNHYLYDTNNVQTGRFYTGKVGTTSEIGQAYITIGNSKASGTANNAKGFVVLYGDQTYYSQIVPANGLTANRTITLPNASGTVALTNNLSSYLPLAGGTMTGVISKAGTSSNWIAGRDKALVRLNSYNAYSAITSMKTTNGSWDMGVYTNDYMYFTYTPDTNYNSGTNSGYVQVQISKAGNLSIAGDYQQNGITGRLASITSSAPSLTTANKILWAW